jgi:tetratricopeptide (TPR) repeat protein
VQQVEGKKHFLCYACSARARRWKAVLVGAAALLAALLAWGLFRPAPSSSAGSDAADRVRAFLMEIRALVDQGRFAEARDRLKPELARNPAVGELNRLMALCLDGMGHHEAAIPLWERLAAGDPAGPGEANLFIGKGYVRLGHAHAALRFLEAPLADPRLDARRRLVAGECYLDLERYDEALRSLEGLPVDADLLRLRFRGLTYAGRQEEALRLLAEHQSSTVPGMRAAVVQLRIVRLREAGDFAGALREVDTALVAAGAESHEGRILRRTALAVYLESGDLGKLESEAVELARVPFAPLQAEAIWYRAMGKLAAGKREEAVEIAREFLRRVDRQLSIHRQQTLMMLHLTGDRKETELEKEAMTMSRFWANDLYGYLALATRERKWAQKSLEATPGRNFPYYCIQRLLEK